MTRQVLSITIGGSGLEKVLLASLQANLGPLADTRFGADEAFWAVEQDGSTEVRFFEIPHGAPEALKGGVDLGGHGLIFARIVEHDGPEGLVLAGPGATFVANIRAAPGMKAVDYPTLPASWASAILGEALGEGPVQRVALPGFKEPMKVGARAASAFRAAPSTSAAPAPRVQVAPPPPVAAVPTVQAAKPAAPARKAPFSPARMAENARHQAQIDRIAAARPRGL